MPGTREARLLQKLDSSVTIDATLTFDKLRDVILNVGDKVRSRYKGGAWHPGQIIKNNEDGTYRILYDDGDVEERVKLEHLKSIPGNVCGYLLV